MITQPAGDLATRGIIAKSPAGYLWIWIIRWWSISQINERYVSKQALFLYKKHVVVVVWRWYNFAFLLFCFATRGIQNLSSGHTLNYNFPLISISSAIPESRGLWFCGFGQIVCILRVLAVFIFVRCCVFYYSMRIWCFRAKTRADILSKWRNSSNF